MPQVLPGVQTPTTSREEQDALASATPASQRLVENVIVSGGTVGSLTDLALREGRRQWDAAAENWGLQPRSPTLTAEEATARYGIEGQLTFNAPVSEREAVWRNAAKRDELFRQDVLNRNDSVGPLGTLGLSLLGGLTDPVTVPLNFIPAFGQGALATRLGLGASATSRTATAARGLAFGALEGAAIGGAQEAAVYGLAGLREGRDYDLSDLMLGVTANALFGGGARGSLEALGWRPPPGAVDTPEARRVTQAGGRLEPGRLAVGDSVADLIRRTAADLGEDGEAAVAIGLIESGLDPAAKNPRSSAAGVFQFLDRTWASMGGGDKMDVDLNVRRGVELMRQNRAALSRSLGREPAPWELYLAHQQGEGGARALLADPNRPAVDALRAAGVRNAAEAVELNGGDAGMTAGEFAGLWRRKFADTAGADVGPLRVDPTPEAVALLGPEQRMGALARAVEQIEADQPVDVGRLIDVELGRMDAAAQTRAAAAPAEGVTRFWRAESDPPGRFSTDETATLNRAGETGEPVYRVDVPSDDPLATPDQRGFNFARDLPPERAAEAVAVDPGMTAARWRSMDEDQRLVHTAADQLRTMRRNVTRNVAELKSLPDGEDIARHGLPRAAVQAMIDADRVRIAELERAVKAGDLRGDPGLRALVGVRETTAAPVDGPPAARTLDQAAAAEAAFRRGDRPAPEPRAEPETPEAEIQRLNDDIAALDDELDAEVEAGRLTEAEVEAAREVARDPKAVNTAIEAAAACLMQGGE